MLSLPPVRADGGTAVAMSTPVPATTHPLPATAAASQADSYSDRPDVTQLHRTWHRNLLPGPRHYVIVKTEDHNLLRGEPAVLPGDRNGLATQRFSSLATVFSSLAAVAVVPEAAVPLLLAGAAVGVGFGTRKSVVLARRAAFLDGKLRQEQAEVQALEDQLRQAPTHSATETAGRLETLDAVQEVDKVQHQRALVSLYPGGIVPVIGTVVGATALLSRPALLGGLSAPVAAASPILSFVAAPILAAGAAASASYDIYTWVTLRELEASIEGIAIVPIVGNEAAVQALLEARLAMQIDEAAYSAACGLGLAVGLPATVFGGPWGLGILVPSLIGTLGVSYLRANRTAYEHQLPRLEKIALESTHALINRIDRERQTYLLIKQLKERRRLHYPFGEQSPLGLPLRLINAVRTRVRAQAYEDEPSPLAIIYDLLIGSSRIHATYHENLKTLTVAELAATTADTDPARVAELTQRLLHTDARLAEFAREDAWLAEEFSALTPETVAFQLARALVTFNVFPYFAQRLANDDGLHATLEEHGVLEQHGHDWELDANGLVLLLADDGPLSPDARIDMANRLAEHAERVLLTQHKLNCQYRTRELLDVLAMRLMATPSDEVSA